MSTRELLQTGLVSALMFAAWFLAIYPGNTFTTFHNRDNLVVPFLWSITFVYLHGKKHSYVALVAYLVLLATVFADAINFGALNWPVQLAYYLGSLCITFLLVLVYQELAGTRFRIASLLGALITLPCLTLAAFYIIYVVNFDAPVSKDVFYAISQTHAAEAGEYVSQFVSAWWIPAALAGAILTGFILLRQEQRETRHIDRSLLTFLVLVFGLLAYHGRSDLRLYAYAVDAAASYARELALFRQAQQQRSTAEIAFTASKQQQGETYVVVIGESLSKTHMQLYGYMRDTTPQLAERKKQQGLLVFNHAYANHTHTMPVLSLALTEANQKNGKPYFESLSLLNVFAQAGFRTHWLTNQNLYGAWDNQVSIIAHEASELVALNKTVGESTATQQFDHDMLPELERILADRGDRNRLILIHLMGNHSAYCARYPGEFMRYDGALSTGEFGRLANSGERDLARRINCYDNSVLYHDHVLDAVLQRLQDDGDVAALWYFADHADDVIAGTGHNSGKFSFEMARIPLLAWFSPAWRERYPERYARLAGRTDTLFVNDLMYDTLIGTAAIDTDRYDTRADLGAADYRQPAADAMTLHGRVAIAGDNNSGWHQAQNIAALVRDGQAERAFPHRVDSLGKLRQAWHAGYRAFETDVRFQPQNGGYLEVGHDAVTRSGLGLEAFLRAVETTELRRLWLDIKNLDGGTAGPLLAHLQSLDERYALKPRVIIESSDNTGLLGRFSAAGFHTAYYLPTEQVRELMTSGDRARTERLAEQIAAYIGNHGIAAASFDARLYPFVSEHLSGRLPARVVYHTWDLSLRLADRDFGARLKQRAYAADPRVRSILVVYQSPFTL